MSKSKGGEYELYDFEPIAENESKTIQYAEEISNVGSVGSVDSKDNSKTPYGEDDSNKKSMWKNFIDGFKRMELGDIDPNLSEVERANIIAERAPLKRSLKNRHVQMIAIGSAIGTGLFVGSGTALRTGGPASLIICYFLIGTMIFCTVQALGELAVAYPVAGSFLSLNSRFISPIWGFCMAWNYVLQWIIVMPLELVAASLTIRYWNDEINSAAWVTIFYFTIVFINIFGVKGYGEAEFVFSTIKVVAILGFIILGIVLNCGGGPVGGYIGGKYWYNPGAFHHGFKGLCGVFVTAAFSFSGTELVGLTSAETANPRKTLPSATKQVFWRITLFYMVSLTLIGLLVPYNDPRLMGNSSADAAASPFVIAIRNAGIKGLPSVMNAVILIAVLSVANSAVFAASRTVASLADQGFAPKFFGYIDRKGRPLVGVGISFAFGLLCYLAASDKEAVAFAWMMAISGLSSIFTWGSICFTHVRFRRALHVQGRGTNELTFTAMSGVYGSIWGVILNILVLMAEFWYSLFPTNKPDAYNFFENYLNAVVLVFFFFVYLIWKKFRVTFLIRAKDVDLDTGRRVEDWDLLKQEIEEEKAFIASKPFYYRVYKMWC
ncbi:glyceraldehyde-3-phosphate dehydrogenase 1 [Pichia californica]|uniref:Glyceraldehyde-3-phosphate dehydrogenase 1 n=1 Tax=Pichia californica TaxID=460514 RepID=A0A9P6WKD1_9ASCO|nr:glyceraldehyde-3-phosphate dehydrogenase 1 [[Candida] californica]